MSVSSDARGAAVKGSHWWAPFGCMPAQCVRNLAHWNQTVRLKKIPIYFQRIIHYLPVIVDFDSSLHAWFRFSQYTILKYYTVHFFFVFVFLHYDFFDFRFVSVRFLYLLLYYCVWVYQFQSISQTIFRFGCGLRCVLYRGTKEERVKQRADWLNKNELARKSWNIFLTTYEVYNFFFTNFNPFFGFSVFAIYVIAPVILLCCFCRFISDH